MNKQRSGVETMLENRSSGEPLRWCVYGKMHDSTRQALTLPEEHVSMLLKLSLLAWHFFETSINASLHNTEHEYRMNERMHRSQREHSSCHEQCMNKMHRMLRMKRALESETTSPFNMGPPIHQANPFNMARRSINAQPSKIHYQATENTSSHLRSTTRQRKTL